MQFHFISALEPNLNRTHSLAYATATMMVKATGSQWQEKVGMQ
jgi:hypothetical protein